MLASWGVEFEPINVVANPEAQAELRRLSIPAVPATVVGDRAVHGWNPEPLAALVGVAYQGVPPLSPPELAARLDEILSMAQHGIGRVAGEGLETLSPGRPRNLRDLAFHTFRVAASFADALEQGYFPEQWLFEEAPAHLRTGRELAAHGEAVRARLATWFAQADPGIYDTRVETYHGEQSVHALLERTAWHTGQHLRQVWALLEQVGAVQPGSLDSTMFDGLPMPAALW